LNDTAASPAYELERADRCQSRRETEVRFAADSFSVYAPCKINAPPEAQEAVGGGQELSGGAPRADES
jgi:hypothetical protein